MKPQSEVAVGENEESKSLCRIPYSNGSDITEGSTCLGEGLSTASFHPVENKLHDLFRLKKGSYSDIPVGKLPEIMKSNSLENISTKSLFTAVKCIVDDSIERKNGDITKCMASLLKLVVQEIEQRSSKQAEAMKKQNSLYKSREQKYISKLRALEALARGTTEENEVVNNYIQEIKIEKTKIVEKKKIGEQDEGMLIKEKDQNDNDIFALRQKLELDERTHKKDCFLLEMRVDEAKSELEEKIEELESLLTDSRKKVEELKMFSERKSLKWEQKELGYKTFINRMLGSLQDIRAVCNSMKQEISNNEKLYLEELNDFGSKLKELADAFLSYHSVLAENRKLYNEVQDLKGNIRVYCRIRPFFPGQNGKETTIEFIGDNAELVVANPSKQGKDSHRLFKFNKVFGPMATQEEVFLDTQPLIRSVLDGYNVCIFAYGQTGSGKTYTMSGPSTTCMEDWGVNYRALNDLFNTSQQRKSFIAYEIGVQMVEIYNEQVRDLLCVGSPQKRLGIWNSAQPNGLAVPDASMHPVNSTVDVLELMDVGLTNRAIGVTALNERSSRSHSILTVHVRGMDLKTKTLLRGCLHLVDLAGSERVDGSEAKGDRLWEAQHINKSLSALGDVIFALAQKNAHVPFRNSKLTQVLQRSLGGQAKTLMFVHLNPDEKFYSETLSSLKFAERVSTIELGAAKRNKEGIGIKELMEQVACLKDTIENNEKEIERLRLLRNSGTGDVYNMRSPRYGSSSPRKHSIRVYRPSRMSSRGKTAKFSGKVVPVMDENSEYSDRQSEVGSQPSIDDISPQKEFLRPSRFALAGNGQNSEIDHKINEDVELLGFGNVDSEERLSDISDGVLSMGEETDCSLNSIVEFTLFPETAKPVIESVEKPIEPANSRRPPEKPVRPLSSRMKLTKSYSKLSASSRKTMAGSSSASKPSRRWL